MEARKSPPPSEEGAAAAAAQRPRVADSGTHLRPYQQYFVDLVRHDAHNYIVSLPTGAGKTLIAEHWAREAIRRHPFRCVVFVVPTVALLTQQATVFGTAGFSVTLFHGGRGGNARLIWLQASAEHFVVFCTPQMLFNALQSGHTSFDAISLLIFDECHHAVKKNPYNEICKLYARSHAKPRILGLSASPSTGRSIGETRVNLRQMCRNYQAKIVSVASAAGDLVHDLDLHVNRPQIEYADSERAQGPVRDFVEEIYVAAAKLVKECDIVLVDQSGTALSGAGCEFVTPERVRQSEFISSLCDAHETACVKSKHITDAIMLLRAIESVEMFGALPESNSDAVLAVLTSHIPDADLKLSTCASIIEETDSPKLQVLRRLLQEHAFDASKHGNAIIFVKTREGCSMVSERLKKWASRSRELQHIRPSIFLGHNNRSGEIRMTIRRQKDIIADFRERKVNVLVATSVAEEGIDVPTVGLVVRFDEQMTTLNLVQSRGRARAQYSKYFIVCEPEDRAVAEAAVDGEQMMNEAIKELSAQQGMQDFLAENTWLDEDRDQSAHFRLQLERRGLDVASQAAAVSIEQDWNQTLEDVCDMLKIAKPHTHTETLTLEFRISRPGQAAQFGVPGSIELTVNLTTMTVTLAGEVFPVEGAFCFNQEDSVSSAACKVLAHPEVAARLSSVWDHDCLDKDDLSLMNSISTALAPRAGDAKSQLNLLWQQRFRPCGAGLKTQPLYYSVRFGADHMPVFLAVVIMEGRYFIGTLEHSKIDAEQSAAAEALKKLCSG